MIKKCLKRFQYGKFGLTIMNKELRNKDLKINVKN